MSRSDWIFTAACVALIAVFGAFIAVTVPRDKSKPPGPAVSELPGAVIRMPDGAGDIAHACDGHGHRVYSTHSHPYAVAVIADPTCGEAK